MNENLDLTKILKDTPVGTKLWSPICGECELEKVSDNKDAVYPILCKAVRNSGSSFYEVFTANGAFSHLYGCSECMLFPSKENRDWATFQVSKQHKHFEPFQKVLRIDDNNPGYKIWIADIYSHYDENDGKHYLTSGFIKNDDEIISYYDNKDKLGKVVEK